MHCTWEFMQTTAVFRPGLHGASLQAPSGPRFPQGRPQLQFFAERRRKTRLWRLSEALLQPSESLPGGYRQLGSRRTESKRSANRRPAHPKRTCLAGLETFESFLWNFPFPLWSDDHSRLQGPRRSSAPRALQPPDLSVRRAERIQPLGRESRCCREDPSNSSPPHKLFFRSSLNIWPKKPEGLLWLTLVECSCKSSIRPPRRR